MAGLGRLEKVARRGRLVVGRQKRLTQWVGPALQEYIPVSSTGATIIGSFDPAAAGFPKPTIVRTRGMISIKPNVDTADLSIVGAFGMAIVSDQAFTAGVLSVPEPFTDADWNGWFVWRSFSYRLVHDTDAGKEFLTWDFEVDSKAMRKVSTNETLVLVAESFLGSFDISAPVRILMKLS